MITISFFVSNYWYADASIQSVREKLNQYVIEQEKKAKTLFDNKKLLEQLVSNNYDEKTVQLFAQEKYFLFLYKLSEDGTENLKFWNTQQVLPPAFMLYGEELVGFVHMDNGYYVWKKYEEKDITGIILMPIKWDFFLENEYLKNDFYYSPSISSDFLVAEKKVSDFAVNAMNGQPLFYIYEKGKKNHPPGNWLALISQILALISIIYYLQLIGNYLALKKGWKNGFFFFFSSLFILRSVTYLFQLPFSWQYYRLFQQLQDLHILNRSLGDMLINALLILWVLMFIRSQVTKNTDEKIIYKKGNILLNLIFASLTLLLFLIYFGNVMKTLAFEPDVSFHVNNFYTLDQFSVYAIAIIIAIAIALFVFTQLVLMKMKLMGIQFKYLLITLAVISLLLLSFRVGKPDNTYYFSIISWFLLMISVSEISWFRTYDRSLIANRLVFWIVFYSFFISWVVRTENAKKELEQRKKYAIALAKKSNPANEVMVNTMLTGFNQDFLNRNFSRFAYSLSSSSLKDSIISSNTSSYTNHFETKIFTYNVVGSALHNQEDMKFDELNAIWQIQSKPTSAPGLKYFDQSFDVFSYIAKKEVKDSLGNLEGTVFILAIPKSQRSDAIYPELFSKGQASSIENSSLYATAFYIDNKLIRFHNDYPFPSVISTSVYQSVRFLEKSAMNYDELWYNAGGGLVVLIVKKSDPFIESITLFSYFFFGFLSFLALLWVGNVLVNSRLNRKKLVDYWRLSLHNQIHGAIISISIISFIVIALASVIFFTVRYEKNNREKLNRTIRIMEKEAKATLSQDWDRGDTLRYSIIDHKVELEKAIQKISEIHGVDVNIYDLKGDLKVSSLPLPYNKGILSTKMNPSAYYHLNKKKEIQFFQKENIGKLSYISNYIPLMDAAGNEFAYINIPYFTSQNILRQEISNFLITIINLNAFIFLLAGIFSLFITERIGNTISLVGEKMKRIALGIKNEQIQWDRDDEIGTLVKEYNKMVLQLEASAAILAKTEREGAWREMARQVAHEIKNPLTPMKLSMQFLQKSIAQRSPDILELARKVSITLIEQIDHLGNIANAFSQFASIGEPNKELFDLNETLRNILVLHETNDNMRILRQLLQEPIIIYADKTQIHRLFTNLMINAVQSVPIGQTPSIIISQRKERGRILTSIRDNGSGISESVRSNIFTPNFTTKTSGTGLGLAMCKRIVEQSDGDIYFETSTGEGTTFTVEIPYRG